MPIAHPPAPTPCRWTVIAWITCSAFAPAPAASEITCFGKAGSGVQALIDAKDWTGAEALARQQVADRPDDLEARLDLARVHVATAASSVLVLDGKAMGIPTDSEGRLQPGAHEVSLERLDAGLRSGLGIEPRAGAAAERALEDVLVRWPKHLAAHLCLVDLLRRRGDHAGVLGATVRAATAHSDDPGSIEALLRPGVAYGQEGDLERAEAISSRLLAIFPGSGLLLGDLAAVISQRGRVREALPLLERAAAASPTDPICVANVAQANRLLGNHAEAERWFSRLHELDPTEPRPLFDLAMLGMRGDPKRSLAAWDRYLQAHASHPDQPPRPELAKHVRDAVVDGLSDGDAATLVQDLIARDFGVAALPLVAWLQWRRPALAGPVYLEALILERAGQPVLAAEKLLSVDALLATDDESGIRRPEVWWNLGRNLHAGGRSAEALAWLAKVEGAAPETRGLRYFLGNVHAAVGHDDEARHYWTLCLGRTEDSDYVQYCRSNLDTPR